MQNNNSIQINFIEEAKTFYANCVCCFCNKAMENVISEIEIRCLKCQFNCWSDGLFVKYEDGNDSGNSIVLFGNRLDYNLYDNYFKASNYYNIDCNSINEFLNACRIFHCFK